MLVWKGKQASQGSSVMPVGLANLHSPCLVCGVCLSTRRGVGSFLCMFCRAGSRGALATHFLLPSPRLSLLQTFHLSRWELLRGRDALCSVAVRAVLPTD